MAASKSDTRNSKKLKQKREVQEFLIQVLLMSSFPHWAGIIYSKEKENRKPFQNPDMSCLFYDIDYLSPISDPTSEAQKDFCFQNKHDTISVNKGNLK